MASPQIENGFVMIALDLFAAIMMADLPNRCMIVLSYHLVHSYGPAKKRDVFLDPATIEEHTRLHRNNVRRAVKELADAKILMRRVGGAYRFNKDYEAWMPGGKPFVGRLGGGPVEFTTWAKGAQGKPVKKSKKDPIQPDCPAVAESGDTSMTDPIQRDSGINDEPNPTELRTTVGHNPTGLGTTVVRPSSGIGTNTDENHVTDSVNGEIPKVYDETLARDRRRAPGYFRLENEEIPPQPPPGGVVVDEGSTPPPEPGPTETPNRPDPTVVAGLEDLARAVFRNRGELEDYPSKVTGWLHCYPADWVRDAIVCTGAKDGIRSGGLAQYTAACLRRWYPNGPTRGEVRKAEAAVGAAAKPAPPTEYHQAPANSRHRIKRDD